MKLVKLAFAGTVLVASLNVFATEAPASAASTTEAPVEANSNK
ncbi:hypothetical protein [Acinetobacter terrestris]|nr:hypothetical protein [Acinetobacter terrestris]